MESVTNFLIESRYHDKPIVSDVFYNKNEKKKPIVIFCHGYKGFKDWGAWNLMAEYFAENEFVFIKFNFSHNGGTSKEPIDFSDLEAFSENNFTTELNDLEDVIAWIRSTQKYKDEFDTSNITLIGHSRGGGITTIKASENPNVTNTISWNGVSDFGSRFPKGEALELWKQSGVRFVENGRTKQQMPHKYQFYQDFKDNEKRLTIRNAVERMTIPQLIVNGSSDVVVIVKSGEDMNKWNSSSEWIVIDEMNHTLGSKHPWTNTALPTHLEKVIDFSISFIKRNSH